MTFTIDFLGDGWVLEWEATNNDPTERDDYTPRFYVAPRDPDTDIDLTLLRSQYERHPNVVATELVARRSGFRRDEEMKETRFQGLKDQLAGADEDTTEIQAEIEELEQRITDLTSFDSGTSFHTPGG